MTVIKRYPNRKLYNTETKKYITLDGIAELIRDGDELQVLDHTTGEDLTTLTLTQIIFEQEKKKGGFLPHSVLTGLVQAGGERLSSLRNALSAPLELLRQVDDEIETRILGLVSDGELEEDEGLRLIDKLVARAKRATKKVAPTQETVDNLLKGQGIPTQEDISRLTTQLDELAIKLERLNQQGKGAK
jgi:polyhydroxyalkanoate synthesis repressor PhaR